MNAAALEAQLDSLLGPGAVVSDPDVVATATVDWSGRFRGHSPLLVRPRSTEEVAALVAHCASHRVALCPQGGNTGLVGGGVPLGGEVVVSLSRLKGVEVDELAGEAVAAAGSTIAELQRAAGAAGWAYGVDLASRDSATVGGTVATNAGGLRTVRHGPTRAQLLGIEAVLGDGSVVSHLAGLRKDNTGYDLAALLCGSEGTLGVITAARVRLLRPAAERAVALVAFPGVEEAVAAAAALRADEQVEAIEFMLARGIEAVCEASGLAPPSPLSPAYLLFEVATDAEITAALERAMGLLGGPEDSAVALEPERRAELWAYRERHTEVINRLGVPHKLDVSLPMAHLAGFILDVEAKVRQVAPRSTTFLFGHAGDGNVHVNVVGIEPDDDSVDQAVLELVAERQGSISAEHGIGRAKRRFLALSRSPAELAAFRAIKGALDPAGILNPGVLV